MKILENILGNDIYEHRDEWRIEHVTTPRESCLTNNRARLTLSRMCIDDMRKIGDIWVTRIQTSLPKCYRIERQRFTLTEALDIVEGRVQLNRAKPALDAGSVETVPPPRVFPTAIDYSVPVATMQVDLFTAA